MQSLSSWNGENSSMPPPIPIDLGTWDVHEIQLGVAIKRENISAVGALGWASKIHNVMFACNVASVFNPCWSLFGECELQTNFDILSHILLTTPRGLWRKPPRPL